jgi:DNA-directed RNA polymerase specialized sigma24 family protein
VGAADRQHGRRVVLALVAAGFGFGEAEDLAQEAWARLMEKDGQGRFRS